MLLYIIPSKNRHLMREQPREKGKGSRRVYTKSYSRCKPLREKALAMAAGGALHVWSHTGGVRLFMS